MGDSEFDLIEELRESSEFFRYGSLQELVKGIGDDAAVVEQTAGLDTVISADLLVEGIDFKLTDDVDACAYVLGLRAVAVSLSDVAAMGARPRWLLLSIGVPQKLWEQGFARALSATASLYAQLNQVTLVGGDISRTPEHVVIDSIVVGDVEHGRAVLRSGAKPGDQIYVTGFLGGAAHTLRDAGRQSWYVPNSRRGAPKNRFFADLDKIHEMLTRASVGRRKPNVRQTKKSGAPFSSAHSAADEMAAWFERRAPIPQPRVRFGSIIGSRRLATAMIDISDGLSSDLAHICRESGVGARIEAESLPLDPLLKFARLKKADALALALHGGEDFELLFTVRPRRAKEVEKLGGEVPVTRIGEITNDAGRIELIDGRSKRILKPAGFEHFKRSRR
jgi:thiamine-monophosphate kinase